MPVAGKRGPAWDAVAVLGGLTLVGLALRLPSMDDSLWRDELSTNFVVHGFGVGNLFEIRHGDQEGTPPLFFMFTWLTSRFDGNEGLRFVSLLAGLAAIPLTYVLGVRTVGRSAATVGAALVALSPLQIIFSTEARGYALMMFLCLLAAVTLLFALDSGRTRWWVAYAISAAAAMYTHYTSLFVLIGLFGWAFVARPEARRPLLLATLGAALLFAPWIPEFISDSGKPAAKVLGLLHPFSLASAKSDLLAWSIGHPLLPTGDVPGRLAVWLIVAGLLVGAVGLAARFRVAYRERSRPALAGPALVIVLALATPIGLIIHQLFTLSVFIPRNLIASWPGFALSIGALVTAGRPPLRFVAVGLLLGGFALGGAKLLDRDRQHPDYLGAVDFIESTGEPDSPVVDLAGATPGPQTDLEAALAPHGEPGPEDRELWELTLPTIDTRLSTRLESLPILDPLLITRGPVPSEQEIAMQAARSAGSGPIFLVTAVDTNIERLRRDPGPIASFLAALGPSFHEVTSRRFPGILNYTPTVHVLVRSAP
jgi:dolichyl-phosphate-mannose-protein mannosyltransferase